MLFNSLTFLVFFSVVLLLYFNLPFRFRWQLLLASSALFYMAFIPSYILILVFTILVDYFSGLMIERSTGRSRRTWLILSLATNIGVLAFFKYFNFVSANLTALLGWAGLQQEFPLLAITLPIGLSFHTFQSMSYTIEVYKGSQPAERHLGILALYVLFFPQLVAGPIERPQNLIHQFREPHSFDYESAVDGLRLMLWGYFKKIVIADRLSIIAGRVFENPTGFHGFPVLLATLAFSFQIYCDFSGYSDIARGAARVLGFRLMVNFDRPYLAASIPEFWRRWHMSLSTWFRDYVYVPLGGNRVSKPRQILNIGIVFGLSGLWHGANWTFLIWGLLHAAFFSIALIPIGARRIPRPVSIGFTFILVSLAWIFFRARSLHDALYLVSELPDALLHSYAGMVGVLKGGSGARLGALMVAVLLIVEALQDQVEITSLVKGRAPWQRWIVYYATLTLILVAGVFGESAFIYFQF